jgi:hypothetical protein
MRKLSASLLLLTILLLTLPAEGQYSGSLPVSSVSLSGTREVPLNVQVVFLGLSSSGVNSTYLTAEINLPSTKSQTILAGAHGTGVIYRFKYQVRFANDTLVNSFVSFLRSIEVTETYNLTAGDFRNPYFDNSTTQVSFVRNAFYNATSVENWFASRLSSWPSPVPGYTLFVADLHNHLTNSSLTYERYQNYTRRCTGQCTSVSRATATAHYYNRTTVDPDLGLEETRHFMTGWGGNRRFHYLDISAGPSHWTEELPIQVASGLRGVDPATQYGPYWQTQFVANYLQGVIHNLFAPDWVYPVNYATKYNFHLFVFDNRNGSEMSQLQLTSTVKEDLVEAELEKLIPYSNVTVTTRFANVSTYLGLEAALGRATTPLQDPAVNGSIVDARLVYDWLSTYGEGHVSQFINVTATSESWDIPAFIFAFTGPYNFGFTFKEDVFLSTDPDSIYGVALGDLVLISHGHYDLTAGDHPERFGRNQPGKGLGFTRTIIHELGHMLGLAHPFSYDLTEDFTDSVMGYYPNSLTFSQFDKDTFLRGINDQLLIFAEVTLAETTSNIFNTAQISAANRAIAAADDKYSRMQYAEAVPDSYSAALNALTAHQISTLGPLAVFSPGLVFGLIGLAVGVGVGFLVAYLVLRRRTQSGIQFRTCPTCQQPLRWDAVMMRWYCDRCQKPV